MRIKSAIFITAIVSVVVAVSYILSVSLTRDSIIRSMAQDLSFASSIASDFTSTKIDLLKADARHVADKLDLAGSAYEQEAIFREALYEFPDFLSFTIFDRKSVLAQYGPAPTSVKHLGERYIQRALNGESLISTTRLDEDSGELVLHICVPIGKDKALSVTIPGMIFSKLLSKYKLWKTGGIFIIDENGVVISSYRDDLALERRNFIEEAKTDDNMESAGAFFSRMLSEREGIGNYRLWGTDRFCSFRRIASSVSGWTIGVTLPLPESLITQTEHRLLLAALALFVFGAMLSLPCSGLLARHYYQIDRQKRSLEESYLQIENQNRHLEELEKAAHAASDAKSSFLANMSHEMRTPLNAIIGLSMLALQNDDMGAESEEQVTKVYSSGITLLSIVNDILDISKIESGKLELNPVDYDLASLVNNTIAANILRLGEKQVKFVIDLDKNLPSVLFGDDIRLKQVFSNILSNSFKYTNEGTVAWSLTFEREGDVVWLISVVKDTGIGIKPEDADKLFAEYAQVDMSSHRNVQGTGLGLAITKRLVDLMNGFVTVESEYGKGSTFTLRLEQGFVTDNPIGETVANNISNYNYTDSKLRDNAKFKRIMMPYAKILVVDDVQTNIDVARGMIKPYKIHVDFALSGQEAINLVQSKDVIYNAIFMDHMMPGMDGIEATRRIRAIGTEYAGTVPIIALTANAIVGNDKMFLENGFQDFLSKPIDVKMLDKILMQWIRDKTPPPSDAAENGGINESEADEEEYAELPEGFHIDGADIEAGINKFAGDTAAYTEVLRSYVKSAKDILPKMETLLKQGDWEEYAINAHGMKGASYGICAETAGDAAKELERAGKSRDGETLTARHAPFVELMQNLTASIEAALALVDASAQMPLAEKPNSSDLAILRKYAADFDMDGVDAVMKRLEAYKYEEGGELVVWLREQVDAMNFEVIERGEWGA